MKGDCESEELHVYMWMVCGAVKVRYDARGLRVRVRLDSWVTVQKNGVLPLIYGFSMIYIVIIHILRFSFNCVITPWVCACVASTHWVLASEHEQHDGHHKTPRGWPVKLEGPFIS